MRRAAQVATSLALLAACSAVHAQAQAGATPAQVDASAQPELGARAVITPENAGASSLHAREARQSAAALGEPARAVANLPGVARSSFDAGELVIWGASGRDQRVYIDGVELPALFHPGGFRSTVHPALLERVTLTPGTPGAQYGRALGATLALDSPAQLPAGQHLQLTADEIDASLALRGTLGPVRALWAVRAGYLDRLQRWLAPDSQGIVPLPAYVDGVARVQLAQDSSSSLTASWLGSHDHYQLGSGMQLGGQPGTRTQRRDFQLGWLRFERRYADGARTAITPFVGVHHFAESSRFGPVPALLDRAELRYGLRAHYTRRIAWASLSVGADALGVRSALQRSGTLTLPAREGDLALFGQPPDDELASDRWSTDDVNVAPYAQLRLPLGPLALTPGLRLETYALATSRRTPKLGDTPAVGSSALFVRPEPRLAARIALAPWLALAARAGVQHQAPAPEDRSAVFGNPQLKLAHSETVAGGPVLQLRDALGLELTGFYKRLSDLPVRSQSDPPPLAGALAQSGRGRAFGAQLGLEQRLDHGFSAALAYTLSRSERSDASGRLRVFEGDQTHVLSALIGYEHAHFTLGARARLASGRPRTAVVGSYFDPRDDRYEPLLGAFGGARLPLFFALDLRVERAFDARALRWALYLDVLNATNQRNVEEVAYDFDYGARADITGLPLLAVLGARLEL